MPEILNVSLLKGLDIDDINIIKGELSHLTLYDKTYMTLCNNTYYKVLNN
jgi:hypothetical protein